MTFTSHSPVKNLLLIATFGVLFAACSVHAENEPDTTAPPPQDYDGPIIDMHLHVFPEGSPMFGRTHPPTLRGKTYQGVPNAEEQMRKTLEKMKEHNIVMAMVEGGEAWRVEAPDNILVGHGEELPAETLRQLHSEGNLDVMAEMSPFYAGVKADDESLQPYFDLAEELDVPIGFHILPGGPNGGLYLMPEMLGGMRAAIASPMQIEKVLVTHPEMKVYLMHGGWPYTDDVKALMYMHPQLYVDVAVINWLLPEKEFHNYLTALTDAGFGDRIMYGSDQMSWPQVISDGIAAVNSAPLTDQQKADIFYNNAARFLELSEDEIAAHKERQ